MSQVVTFLELLGKLEAGGSPFSRMKTLSEFWRFLAGLDRKQRLQLSKTLGLDQGEQILERFLANPGTRASEMLSWIETVLGTLDPGQVEALTKDHLSSSESKALFTALGTLGLKRPVTAESERPSPPPTPIEESVESEPGTEGNQILQGPTGRDSAEDFSREAEEALTEPTDVKEHDPPELVSASEEEEYPAAQPEEKRTVERADAAAPDYTHDGHQSTADSQETSQPNKPLMRVEKSYIETTDPESEIAALLQELTRFRSPVSRYRFIRASTASISRIKSSDASKILENLNSRWMQKRFLSSTLRTNIELEDFDSVMELIQSQNVCATDYICFARSLLESDRLSQEQMQLLVDLAPSSMVKRLLSTTVRAILRSKSSDMISV